MPRNSSGDFTLVAGNPVAPGEIIASQWANTTMEDIALALSDSLDRRGRGGMLAPFKFADGSRSAPGATWTNEPNTGLYRAGAGDLRMSVRANDVMRWRDDAAYIWNSDEAVWEKILSRADIPDGTQDGQTIRWNDGDQRWNITSVFRVMADGEVLGLFKGSNVQQPYSRIESVDILPPEPDDNTLYIVRL